MLYGYLIIIEIVLNLALFILMNLNSIISNNKKND